MLWLEKSPSYFRFYNRTIKLEEPDGTVEGKEAEYSDRIIRAYIIR
jgi:hypothetical protein